MKAVKRVKIGESKGKRGQIAYLVALKTGAVRGYTDCTGPSYTPKHLIGVLANVRDWQLYKRIDLFPRNMNGRQVSTVIVGPFVWEYNSAGWWSHTYYTD